MSLRMTITVLDVLNDLENLRKMCGFSKVDVAREIGTHRMTYHNWLAGKNIPHSKWEPELTRALLWMQGLVAKRKKKERFDARRKGGDEDNV